MKQLFLDLRGMKNHWGPFPHPCPRCGTEVFTDAIMSEVLCDDCNESDERWLDSLRKQPRIATLEVRE